MGGFVCLCWWFLHVNEQLTCRFLSFASSLLSSQVLGVRARYEKELRGLHEDKNRSEEEIRQQLRDEKVKEEPALLRVSEVASGQVVTLFVSRPGRRSWRVCSRAWTSCRLRFRPWRGPKDGSRDGSKRQRSVQNRVDPSSVQTQQNQNISWL